MQLGFIDSASVEEQNGLMCERSVGEDSKGLNKADLKAHFLWAGRFVAQWST